MELLESRIAPAAIYVLDHQNHVLVLDSQSPSTVLETYTFSQGSEHLLGISSSAPASGSPSYALYGLSDAGSVYGLDFSGHWALLYAPSGIGKLIQGAAQSSVETGFGNFFLTNPSGTSLGQTEGEFTTTKLLSYAKGDPNAHHTPDVQAIATTGPGPHFVYGIDSKTGALVEADAASGKVTTVGSLGVAIDAAYGLTILPDGRAYASLAVGVKSELFSIDLVSGHATALGVMGDGATLLGTLASTDTYVWTGTAGDTYWSTAGNWEPKVRPDSGAMLEFPASTSGTSNNDLPAGQLFARVQIDTAKLQLTGNAIAITRGFIADAALPTSFPGLLIAGDVTIEVINLSLEKLDLAGHTVHVGAPSFIYDGVSAQTLEDTVGGGTVQVDGSGSLHVASTNGSVHVLLSSGATFYVNGDASGATVDSVPGSSGELVTGAGIVGSINLGDFGTVSPTGGGSALITLHGLNLGTNFYLGGEVNSTTDYPQIVSKSPVVLDSFVPSVGYAAGLDQSMPVGTVFTLIDNQSSAPVAGTATALEGSIISFVGADYQLSFQGGDGNDVTLTRLAPPTVTITDGATEAGGSDPVDFHVILSRPSPTGVKLQLNTASGTAKEARDYSGVHEFDVFYASDTVISVAPVRSSAVMADGQFSLTATALANATPDTIQATGTLHFTGLEPALQAPIVRIVEGNHGLTSATISVSLTHSFAADVTFTYYTDNEGTAEQGIDYVATQGTITIPAGLTTASIPVKIIGDRKVESAETFNVELRDVHNASTNGPFEVEILNDDGPPIYVQHYRDVDGDEVTVRDTLGRLEAGIALVGKDLYGDTSLRFDFSAKVWGQRFAGDDFTFTVKEANGGDGKLAIDFINAVGVNLGHVSVEGTLGFIDAGSGPGKSALASLSVSTLGEDGFGSSTVPAGSSLLNGNVGKLTVAHDVAGARFYVEGSLQTLTVGGNLVGESNNSTGEIQTDANLGSATILGTFMGNLGDYSGSIYVAGNLGSLSAGALSGNGEEAGSITAMGKIGSITVRHDITGGPTEYSAHIGSTKGIGSIVIGGGMYGGAGDFSGEISTSGDIGTLRIGTDLYSGGGIRSGSINADGDLMSATINGSVIGYGYNTSKNYGIFVGGTLGSLRIGGDLSGDVDGGPIQILVAGLDSTQRRPAIGSLTIGGEVDLANILAGYDKAGQPVNAAAGIGTVTVRGDWMDSNLVAGTTAGADGQFGTSDDTTIDVGDPSLSRIASLTIRGGVQADTSATPGSYGVVAAALGRIVIDGQKMTLPAGPDTFTPVGPNLVLEQLGSS